MSKYWKIKANSGIGYDKAIEIPLIKKDDLPDDAEIETFARKNRKLGKEGDEGTTSITVDGVAYPVGIDDGKGLRRNIGYFQDDAKHYHGVASGAYGFILLLLAIIVAIIAVVSFLYPVDRQRPDSDTVIVPPVVGMTVENATDDIETVGLNWKINGVDDDDAIVTSESPVAYTQVAKGTTVTLVTRETGNDQVPNTAAANNENTDIEQQKVSDKIVINQNTNTIESQGNVTATTNETQEKMKKTAITGIYDSDEQLADGTAAVKVNDKLLLQNLVKTYVTLDDGTKVYAVKEVTGNKASLADKVVPEYLEYNGSVYGSKESHKFDMSNGWSSSYDVSLKKGDTVKYRFAIIDTDNSFEQNTEGQYAYLELEGYDNEDEDTWIDASYKCTSGEDWGYVIPPDYDYLPNSWSGDVKISTDENSLVWNEIELTANQDGYYEIYYGGYGLSGDTMIIEEPTVNNEKGFEAWNDDDIAQFDLGSGKSGNSWFNLSAGEKITIRFAILDTDGSFDPADIEQYVAIELSQYDTSNPDEWEQIGCQYVDTSNYDWGLTDSDGNPIPNSWTGSVQISSTTDNLIWNEITLIAPADGTYQLDYGAWGMAGDTIYMQAPITGSNTTYELNDGFTVTWPDITNTTDGNAFINITYNKDDEAATTNIPLHVHDYRNGIITWDDDVLPTATAVFTCLYDSTHTETVQCTIETEGIIEINYAKYTAQATSSTGSIATDTKIPNGFNGILSRKKLNDFIQSNSSCTSLVFVTDAIKNLDGKYDVSYSQDKSVWAWVEDNTIKVANIISGEKVFACRDMEEAFKNCSNLITIDATNLDTHRTVNMADLFEYCSSLENINLTGWDTSNVTTMEGMFGWCRNLKTVDLSSWNVTKVITTQSMFVYCDALEKINLAGWNLANATDISWTFNNCEVLTELNIANWQTPRIETTNGMFSGCWELTQVDLSSLDTSNVTDMNGMFFGCRCLRVLDLSSFDTRNVTDMQEMFYNCRNLQHVYVNCLTWSTNKVNTAKYVPYAGSIGSAMFTDCFSLHNRAPWSCSYNMGTNLDIIKAVPDNGSNGGFLEGHQLSWSVSKPSTCSETGEETATCPICHNTYTRVIPACHSFTNGEIAWNDNNTPSASAIFICDRDSSHTETVTCGISILRGNEDGTATYQATATSSSGTTVTDTKTYTASIGTLSTERLRNFVLNNHGYWGPTSVVFSLSGVTKTAGYTDVSEEQNGSVWAWVSNKTLYVSNTVPGTKILAESSFPYVFDQSFYYTSIDLNGLNTVNVTNMSRLFNNCQGLVSVDMSSLDTSHVQDMSCMFAGCSKLTTVKLPANVSSVYDMSYMFSGCLKLASLDLSFWNTSHLWSTRYMFNNCTSLTSLNAFADTSSIRNADYMFYNCKALTAVSFDSWNISKAINLSNMFYGCQKLASIGTLWGMNATELYDMSYMFYNCSALSEIDVLLTGTRSLEKMPNIFANCSAVKTLKLSGWDVSHVTDMTSAFYNCSSLTNIDTSSWQTLSLVSVSSKKVNNSGLGTRDYTGYGLFQNCSSLTSLDLSHWDMSHVAERSFIFSGCEKLTSLNISSWWEQNKTPENIQCFAMFYGCKALTSLDTKEWNVSTVTDMGRMFFRCSQLTTLDVSKWNVNNVTSMERLFEECSMLTNIDTASWKANANVEWMFEGCSKLTTIVLSGIVPTEGSALSGTFDKCSALTYVEIPDCRTSKITSLYNTFMKCSSLTSIDLSQLDTSCVTNMTQTFSLCSSLTQLDVSNFDTSKVTDMSMMFQSCPLKNIDVSNWNTENVTSMAWMFNGCKNLVELDTTNWNTSKVKITQYMLQNCSSLEKIYATENWNMDSVTNSTNMFYGSTKLPSYDANNVTKTQAIINDGTNGGYLTCTVPTYDYAVVTSDRTIHFIKSINEGISGITEITSVNGKTYNGTVYTVSGNRSAAFDTSITRASFEDSITPTDMSNWFAGCSELTEVCGLNKINASKCTSLQNTFSGCSSLTSIDLTSDYFTNTTTTEGMFKNCISLISVKFPSTTFSASTNMKDMFSGCKSLKKIEMSDNAIYITATKVIDMSGMFYGCSALTSIPTFSKYDYLEAENVSNMFNGCSSLTEVDFSLLSANKASNFLANCPSLVSVNVSFNEDADLTGLLDGSNNVTTLTISGWRLTHIDGIINHLASNLTSVTINAENATMQLSGLFAGNTKLTSAYISVDCARTDRTFMGCTSLKSVGISSSNITSMSDMFNGCTQLETVEWGWQSMSSVTDMSRTFKNCSNITNIALQYINPATISSTTQMFYGCKSLTSISTCWDWNIDSIIDSKEMFGGDENSYCSKLAYFTPEYTDKTLAVLNDWEDNRGYFRYDREPEPQ